MRIGVLSDTSIPKRAKRLAPKLLEVLQGVEIVLHAGDIASMSVLQELQTRVSLTFAVYGEQDPPEVRKFLQEQQVLEFGGRRLGLVHGYRGRMTMAQRVTVLAHPQERLRQLHRKLLARFPNIDAVVYGHTRRAFAGMVEGVFVFNPGSPLADAPGGPSVGILEITPRGIRGRIIHL